ncbi:MAG: DUF4890 domain-containing protein [Bacteroidetes bacterium]|nr:DUF4890 domain-containing protein [Bacteroidota bacterium]
MKNIIFLALMLICSSLFAQFNKDNPGTPKERAQAMTDTMVVRLKLSQEQKLRVYNLNLKYARVMQAEVVDSDKNKISKYWRANEINDQKETELKPILTKEQWISYEQIRNEKKRSFLFKFSK